MPHKIYAGIRIFTLTTAISVLLVQPGYAQSGTKPANNGATASNQSCDGALDIVPSKTMSFVRKRRPGKSPATPAAEPTQKKTSKRQTEESL